MKYLIICTIFLLCSCGKKEIKPSEMEESQKPTHSVLIQKHKWKVADRTVSTGDTSIFGSMAPCDKDDFFEYNISETFIKNEGNIKCFPGKPQIDSSATWNIKNDSLFIVYVISPTQTYTEESQITELDENQLVLINTQNIGQKTYIYTTKYLPK